MLALLLVILLILLMLGLVYLSIYTVLALRLVVTKHSPF
jgi:hypothetical protein